MRIPQWELKETSALKNKQRKYVPAEPQPTPAAVHDFFIGLDDSEEELELEPLEGLDRDTSLNESNDETEDGDHLFPLSVNLGTIRRLYNSHMLAELKTLISKNRGGINARWKM